MTLNFVSRATPLRVREANCRRRATSCKNWSRNCLRPNSYKTAERARGHTGVMNGLNGLARWLGAYAAAALVGYALATVGITTHNLARLGALGIDIGFADAWSTIVFDFKGLSPTFGTITKYGSVVWLGFLIAFGTAHVLHLALARRLRFTHLDLVLF